jgi:NADH-quinone oxidoreductase subunit J
MTDTAEAVAFWVFAIPLVVTALGVVVARNPVYAAMNLVAAFFFMAGIYVLLVAHLIAFMQILVYAGAVMVLFLFVIMLLSIGDEHLVKERKRAAQLLGVAGGLGVLAILVAAVWQATGGAGVFAAPTWNAVGPDFGTVKAVGRLLFTQYLLPFEATSLLLLVAIVGAVVVAKERI